MLQTLGSSRPYGSGQPVGSNQLAFDEDRGQGPNLGHYVGILKRRIFYFLIPLSLIAILGLYFASIQKPMYYSEGKILVESQVAAPDLIRSIVTAPAGERVQLIQQRIMTRDNLLSTASRLGLFPDQSETSLLDLMRQRIQIKVVDIQSPARQGGAISFTVGFEHESPEVALRGANEFITLMLNEDVRTRTSRATETVKILEGEVKGLVDKIESAQVQISDIKRRPLDAVPEVPDQEKLQLSALAALKAELSQKTSVYSDAHPTVVALKKRLAAMEKTITQSPQASATPQTSQADEIEAVQRQRQALEKRLDEANGKLAIARLGESLERDQQSERLQVLEAPTLPQRALKSGRLKMVGIAIALGAMVGVGAIFVAEVLDKSISGSHELLGVVDSHLIICIPYISTRAEILRRKRRVILGGILAVLLLAGLAAAADHWLFGDWAWFALTS